VYRKEGGPVHAVRRTQRAAAAKAGIKVKQALGLTPVAEEGQVSGSTCMDTPTHRRLR